MHRLGILDHPLGAGDSCVLRLGVVRAGPPHVQWIGPRGITPGALPRHMWVDFSKSTRKPNTPSEDTLKHACFLVSFLLSKCLEPGEGGGARPPSRSWQINLRYLNQEADYAHYPSHYYLPSPSDFQTFLRPCSFGLWFFCQIWQIK